MKPIHEALAETLGILFAGLDSFGKPFSTELVLAYLMALDDLDFEAVDVQMAGKFFLKFGDGKIPPAPAFREQVKRARNTRIGPPKVLPISGAEKMSDAETHESIKEVLARMDRGMRERSSIIRGERRKPGSEEAA